MWEAGESQEGHAALASDHALQAALDDYRGCHEAMKAASQQLACEEACRPKWTPSIRCTPSPLRTSRVETDAPSDGILVEEANLLESRATRTGSCTCILDCEPGDTAGGGA